MIKIRGLHKWFKSHHVLQGLDLDIEEGHTLAIIGRSGCGKSVLLKHIMGLLEPDGGHILVDQVDISSLSSRELGEFRGRIGMLFQGAALFDSLTVEENVGFSLYEHTDLSEEVIHEKVREKLALVGLKDIENHMPASLSGGMRKRVGLARAICSEPKIILYDEPTTGLDPINADAINELILEMADRLGVTSIVVTHDMKSAYKVADRIAMLYHGRIIGTGTPDEIRETDDEVIRQFVTGSSHGPITRDES
ncbi:MAG: ABC transporter ATP-binding protein [Candidatus Omnitrophota bacterium]|nr:ABC transporter ATP-binding protein [Candidatus Omnitrophota bacterium]